MPVFTPDSELELLFSPDLIPAEVKAQLGNDLHVRFLCSFVFLEFISAH